MMMMMLTSIILGPFGNYLVPLMIGSKRMAFPRIEALSFWLTPAAYVILLSGRPVRRVPDRLDRLRHRCPSRPAQGEDAYVVAFGLMGVSMILAGFNIDRHHHQLPGARHALGPAADVRVGRC